MSEYVRAPIRTIETPSLILRPTSASDASRIQKWFPNFNLLKYMAASIPWPYPENGAEEFLSGVLPRLAEREVYFWALLEKSNPEQGLIGQIGLTPGADAEHRGFWLAEPYWGRGYMTETVLAVTDFAFGPLGMKEMLLGNALPNQASHRLKEKAGAEIVSIEDKDYIGGRFPGVNWRLTAEQWAANRHRFVVSGERWHV